MKKHLRSAGIGVVVLIAAMTSGFTLSAFAGNPTGLWKTTNGKLTVKVDYCGGQKLCATIVGLAKPLRADGTPKLDKDNPNPALRSRKVIGLKIIDGMTPDGDNAWRGQIYNADDGGTYKGTASLNGNNFQVKACWTVICKKIKFVKFQ